MNIIGLRNKHSNKEKLIFSDNRVITAKNINPYLANAENILIYKRSKPISRLPQMTKGSQPTDGGNLLLKKEDKIDLLKMHPNTKDIIKRFVGAHDFINGEENFCLWLNSDIKDSFLNIESLQIRFDKVKEMRLKSSKKATRTFAEKSYKFTEIRHKCSDSILIPRHSSERRTYIPLGFFDENTIIGDSALAIYDAEPWVFGIISSEFHLLWVRAVGGQLETRIRYSANICYNTFPFPEISQKQKEQINLHVFTVLEEREKNSVKTIAQLYDPDKMPKGLKEAHHQLDLAVERCYRLKPFESDTERLEYLFKEYEKMINQNTLLEKSKKTRKKK